MCSADLTRPVEILLVEDNPGDRDLTRIALQASTNPYKVLDAVDGQEALHMLCGGGCDRNCCTPDLILLDLNLPKVSGLELLAEIKRHPRTKHIPVLVLSSSKAENDVRNSYQLHANGYITKPDDLDGLREVVEAIEAFWFTVVQLPTVSKAGRPASAPAV